MVRCCCAGVHLGFGWHQNHPACLLVGFLALTAVGTASMPLSATIQAHTARRVATSAALPTGKLRQSRANVLSLQALHATHACTFVADCWIAAQNWLLILW